MKKILIGFLIIVAALSIGLYSLYAIFGPSEAAHENLIPEDATAVAIIDGKTLVKESGIKLDITKILEMRKYEIGIDLMQQVYAFLTPDGYLGCATALNDSKDFEGNLDEIRQMDGLTWGTKDGFLVCHDGNRMLLFGPNLSFEDKKIQKQMTELMNRQEATSPLFHDLKKKDAGFKAKLSLKQIYPSIPQDVRGKINDAAKKLASGQDNPDINLEDSIYLDIIAKATGNSITLTASASSFDPQTNALLDEFRKQLKPLTHELDAHIPQASAMWMCLNIDGPAIHEIIKSDPDMASQAGMLNQFANVDDILTALNGDMMIVLGDVSAKNWDVALLAQADKANIFSQDVKRLLDIFGIVHGEYKGKTNKTLFVTNSKSLKKSMDDGGYQIDPADGYGDGCVFFLTVDVNKILPVVSPYAGLSKEGRQVYDFIANDVKKMNLRVTREAVECKVVLNSAINDYVHQWIE